MIAHKWERITRLDQSLSYDFAELDSLQQQWSYFRQTREEASPEAYSSFLDRLTRSWAIETGIIEGLYTLDRGVTETLVMRGISADLIEQGSTNKEPHELVNPVLDGDMRVLDLGRQTVLISDGQRKVRSPADAGRTGRSPGCKKSSAGDRPGPDSARPATVGAPPKPWTFRWARKRRFAEGGLEGVLKDPIQVNRRKLDDWGEAHLVALACRAPAGHDHWTLRLLAGKVVELGLASSMSHEGVRQRLKKTPSSRGRKRSGASRR